MRDAMQKFLDDCIAKINDPDPRGLSQLLLVETVKEIDDRLSAIEKYLVSEKSLDDELNFISTTKK